MKKILNQQDMRDNNLNSILRLIRHCGPITRRQIEAALDISWGAVSGATATLLQQGYIKEVKAAETAGAGRTPTALAVSSQDHFLLGLDINHSGLSGVVTDLAGNVLHTVNAEPTAKAREEWIDEIAALVEALLVYARGKSVLAMGVAMQGAVDAARGVSAKFPAEGWENVPLSEILSARFGLPVFLEHDPDCILYATSADRELRDAILLRVDKGTGMAVMLDGKIFKRFGAFELGFTVQNGRPLDESITTRGVAAAAGCSFAETAQMAAGGHEKAVALFENLAERLGEAVVNMSQIFNVEQFLLCGKMLAHRELFWHKLTQVIGRLLPDRPLHVDVTDVDQAAVGAALLAAARHQIKFE